MLSLLDVPEFISRKEILQHKLEDYDFRQVSPDEYLRSYLKLHSYQLTSAQYMDISTHHRSLHLQHAPGAGKTLSAIATAMKFIEHYKHIYDAERAKISGHNYVARMELDRTTPSVFVLGFGGPKAAFIRDLLGNPEFGFISIAEKLELSILAKNASRGIPADIAAYKDAYSKIKRRITNKQLGGFFKFYGYEEFANRIFSGASSRQLVEIEAAVLRANILHEKGGPTPPTIDELVQQAIAQGNLEVNKGFLAMLENSLLICDEIHNTYNMVSKNNRGVAIQYALENVSSLRLLTMSATPINTSPTEITELANYHLAANGIAERLDRRALFSNRRLKQGSLDVIERAFAGRVSFIQDINLKYFPQRIDVGTPYILPNDIEGFAKGTELPYLRFVQCPMSSLHQLKLNEDRGDSVDETSEEYLDMISQDSPYKTIPPDGYSIFDMVFPHPESGVMFRSSEIRKALLAENSSSEIFARRTQLKGDALIISGGFLARREIGKYCTKAAKLLDILEEIIHSAQRNPEQTSRVMIYHDRVAGNGVLFYQELLIANGYVDEYGEATESTKCMVCGDTLSLHGTTCTFIPARFVIAHSMVEKAVMEDSIQKFNSPDNLYGHSYMIILGSRIIKESYDFKAVRHQIIMSVASSMPTLLQINGRCIRKDSHAGLPQDMWKVFIYILVSTVDPAIPHKDLISPEIYRYAAKLRDYIEIQKIDQRINSVAFDGDIHRKIIMPEAMLARYFPNGEKTPQNIFGNLYFEPKFTTGPPTYTTFQGYKFWAEEIKTITYVIKRAFLRQPIWKYENLWKEIQRPQVNLEVNPMMFSEDNFIIALSALVYSGTPQIPLDLRKGKAFDSAYFNHPSTIMARLLDPIDKFIYKSTRMKIGKVGDYYILSPVADIITKPINSHVAEYSERIRNEEVQIMRSAVEIGAAPIIDIETYSRSVGDRSGIHVDVSSFIRAEKISLNHAEYIEKLREDPSVYKFIYHCPYETQIAIIEGFIKSGEYREMNEIFSFLERVGALVSSAEVKRYKDVSKLLPESVLAGEKIIGYLRRRSVNIFDGTEWIEVNKIAMNRQVAYRENDIVIGYITPAIETKFKIRMPASKIREKVQNIKSRKSHLTLVNVLGKDTRTIEKGVVCTTKNKKELVSILVELGVDFSQHKNTTVSKMCSALKKILLEKEEKQRASGSREKWLYFWWDEQPKII